MSMAVSLEARAPLLDHKLVEFAFTLPARFKVRGTCSKWFFKRAMAGILPAEIIYRRKEGFSIPIKNWLKTELREMMLATLAEKKLAQLGLFQPDYVATLIREHLENRRNHSHRLWPLIVFQLWADHYLTSAPLAQP
jgi:asparagine synthase (glutamine-hydrolysing)